MSRVVSICPGCRARRDLLTAAGSSAIFTSVPLPAHMPTCSARTTINVCGIAVETFLAVHRPLLEKLAADYADEVVHGKDGRGLRLVPRGLLP